MDNTNLTYSEIITRNYNNNVTIKYEIINNYDIYIVAINSSFKQQGNATKSLNLFLEEFSNKNIYLFASSENGTDLKILNKWYESLGFDKCKNLSYIPYNISHCKLIVNKEV